MNNRILGFFVMFFVAFSVQAQDKRALVNDKGQVSQELLQLLALTKVEHDGTIADIVKQTQAEWLRKEGTERWDIVDTPVANKDKFFELFTKMNLIERVDAQQKKYEHALWMGAAFYSVKERLEHLVEMWQQGIRFDSLVLLSGARPLTDGEKTLAISTYQLIDSSCPQTEAELMKLVYEKIEMPIEMRKLSLVIVDVPMKLTKNGTLARPTTGDTVDLWMKLNPLPGNCLVVSNQPYVGYQESVTKSLLPKEFIVDTVGKKSVDTKIGVYLDTLARNLYQEKKRQNL